MKISETPGKEAAPAPGCGGCAALGEYGDLPKNWRGIGRNEGDFVPGRAAGGNLVDATGKCFRGMLPENDTGGVHRRMISGEGGDSLLLELVHVDHEPLVGSVANNLAASRHLDLE